MPEGPEIRRAADQLAEALVGRVATRVWFGLARLKPYEAELTGRRVLAIDSHGKALLTRFEGGKVLYSHNQLYGKWFVVENGREPKTNRSLRVAIFTRERAIRLYSASDIGVYDTSELAAHPYLSKLGPDLLDPALKASDIVERLRRKPFATKRLAVLMLDQSFIAGNGNYLRSEILFDARLHPLRRADSLSAGERRRLANSHLRIGRRAYEMKSVTVDPRIYAALKRERGRGGRASRFWVFNRDGLPCYACGTEIVRESAGTRRIYRCPYCQPDASVTA